MDNKAMTNPRLPLFSLKACLLLSCCVLMGTPASAQEVPALPDLEAVLPSPQEMQDDGEAPGLTLMPEGEATTETAPAVVPTPIPEAGGNTAITRNSEEPEAHQSREISVGGEGWAGSLMFDDEKVKNLLAIYRAYLLGQQEEESKKAEGEVVASQVNIGDIIGKLSGNEKPKEIVEEVLKLSLNSIVFDSQTQWSMWVNGQRFSRKVAEEGFMVDNSQLRVIQANNREVTYLWTPITESYNLVRQRWEDKQNRGDIVTNTQVAQNERVDFNEEARTVTITLRPNQTFVSQFMSVMEGVDKPRSIQAAAAGETAGDAVAPMEEDHEGHHHPEEGEDQYPAHERAENSKPVEAAEPGPTSTTEGSEASNGAKKLPVRNYRTNTPTPPSEPVDPAAGLKTETLGDTPLQINDGKAPVATEKPGKRVLSGSN